MTYRSGYRHKDSLFLDGASDYFYNTGLSTTGVANLNPEGDEAFSISGWVFNRESTFTSRSFMVVKQKLASPFDGYRFSWENPGHLYFGHSTNNGGTRNGVQVFSEDGLAGVVNYQWAHVVGTYDGSETNAGIKIYLNGVDVSDARSDIGTPADMSLGTTAISHDLGFGAYSTSYTSDRFHGQMASFSFWQKALSQDEILELYNGAGDRPGPGNLANHSAYSDLVSWWVSDNASDSGTTINDSKGSHNLTGSSVRDGQIGPAKF